MPRKMATAAALKTFASLASMRPGRNAPENLMDEIDRSQAQQASMRPGRNAPENRPF